MTQATGTETVIDNVTGECAVVLEVLRKQRAFLRSTTRDLTDAQAAQRSTVSELCLGGLIKHVASVERTWVDFITEGASSQKNFADMTEADFQQRADEFRMLPGETLAGVLEAYDEIARRSDAMVAGLTDLNATWPLPEAPWFQEREWSTRQVLLHIIAETAQHSGHADIIREAIDGAKTMG
ncbi:DinB family protein [Nocardia nova]|uniref:DinB family protein n=1 Tax=Nocardia nova TaxID=37330 RepID=UPI0033FCD2E0